MQWTNTSHTCLPQKGSGSQLLSMLQKIFLTRVSHPGGNTSSESISVLLSICPAHGLKTREKKEKNGSCLRRVRATSVSEGTKLKQSNQSPIGGRQLCRGVSLLESEKLLIAAGLRLVVWTGPAMDGNWSAAPPSRKREMIGKMRSLAKG